MMTKIMMMAVMIMVVTDECVQDRECVQGEGRGQFSGVDFLLPP